MKIRINFPKLPNNFVIEGAEKIPEERKRAIYHYMRKDSGAKPISSDLPVYLIPERYHNDIRDTMLLDDMTSSLMEKRGKSDVSEYLDYERVTRQIIKDGEISFGGLLISAEVVEPGSESYRGLVSLLPKNGRHDPYLNMSFVHEILGHVGFIEHISGIDLFTIDDPSIDDDTFISYHRNGEIFSELLQSNIEERNYHSLEFMKDFPSLSPEGSAELFSKVLDIKDNIGKKAVVSLFYQPMIPNGLVSDFTDLEVLIHDLHESEKKLEDLSLVSAKFGGEKAIDIWTRSEDEMRSEAEKIKSRLNHSDYRRGLNISFFENELGLGKVFPRRYIDGMGNPELKRLTYDIDDNVDVHVGGRTLLEIVSSLKWLSAHSWTKIPDYERGIRLLDHFISGLEYLDDFFDIRSDLLTIYEKLSAIGSRGDELLSGIIRKNITFNDLMEMRISS